MTTTTCPGCGRDAQLDAGGTITCPDPYDGPHVMTPATIAGIRQANQLARAISTRRHDQSIDNILRGWAA